jgi:branched-chain amino acid transport system ATP-binding protein
MILEVKNLRKTFGGVVALNNVSFSVKNQEIFVIIGPNGSGKTTLFNVITGFYKPDKGIIYYEGRNITGLPTWKIARLGLVRTFQNTKPFLNLTVKQNVLIGALATTKENALKRTQEAIELAGLKQKEHRLAKELSIQDRKKLEVSRALATGAKTLLLDEPFAGLIDEEIEEFLELIKGLKKSGKTIVLIEHVLKAVKKISERVMVMDNGNKIAEGSYDEVIVNNKVREAYLGETIITP